VAKVTWRISHRIRRKNWNSYLIQCSLGPQEFPLQAVDLDPFSRVCTAKPRDRQTYRLRPADWQTPEISDHNSTVRFSCISCDTASSVQFQHAILTPNTRHLDFISNAAVNAQTNLSDINIVISAHQLALFGHIRRRLPNVLTHEAL